jgi:hypothetical protein
MNPMAMTPLAGAAWIAMAVSLIGHAWFCSRLAGRRLIVPTVLLTCVWAGVVAECGIDLSDAVGVLIITIVAVLWTRRPAAVGAVGVVTGAAVVLTAAAGVVYAHSSWTEWAALAGVERIGPAALWRHFAWLADLTAPVWMLGLLGVVVGAVNARPRRAVIVWMAFNVGMACVFPRICARHVLVLLMPAALTAGAGWKALRTLVSSPMPPVTAITGGLCMFLLAVQAWVPLRAVISVVAVALESP